MRGQISTEYIIVLGVILLAVIPLIYFSFNKAGQETNLNDAEHAISTLQSAIDRIYALGPGNQDVVRVSFPKSVNSIALSSDSKSIIMKVDIYGGSSDFTLTAKTTLSLNNIQPTSGMHFITIQYLDNNIISLSE